MDKTALNAQLVTSRNWTESVFYHLKSVNCGRSDLWKVLVATANEKYEELDFAACQTCLQAL